MAVFFIIFVKLLAPENNAGTGFNYVEKSRFR